MPTNISGRLTLIFAVALAALAAIFWPIIGQPSLAFDSGVPLSKKINLRPGIDMVGGTSLLYEIQIPRGMVATEDLAREIMAALKRRVDPEGVRNLVWRPQGNTRLEIQMPLSAGADEAEQKRAALIEASDKVEQTNVAPAEVMAAVEAKNQKRLDELAMGSPAREALFRELVKTHAAVTEARAAENAAREAELRVRYEDLQQQIRKTNLSIAELEEALQAKNRERRLSELGSQPVVIPAAAGAPAAAAKPTTLPSGQFPARQQAVAAYAKAYDEFQNVRNVIGDTAELKRLLKGSGVLGFHILAIDAPQDEVNAMTDRLATEGPRTRAGDRLKWFEVDEPEHFGGGTQTYNGKQYVLAWIADDNGVPKALDNRAGRAKWALERAYRTQGQFNEGVVGFTFDVQGAQYFGDLTRANVGKPMAIVLDEKVISAPNINEPITGGSGIISGGGAGGFEPAELNYLVRTLSAGSLPAQLSEDPISERTVGPQLGRDNLMRGLIACIFGLVVVAVFLIGYYYLAGVVATIAVFLNMLLILGAMAALPGATITLAGVAGIVLTIGMAVDANVLIFERLREEQNRGLSLRMALRNAYDRAWSAILDGNVTTGITALILYAFGSEEVKGFGLTLLIGIVVSLFTALFVTRTIFAILIDRFGVENLNSLPLTFPRWDRALRPNIDWMSKAWMFYAFSGVFITIGLILFGVKLAHGEMLDIEFAKGTSVQFELKAPMEQDDVRKLIEAESKRNEGALPAPQVVAVGADEKTYEVISPNENSRAVREAVLAAMRDPTTGAPLLEIEVPSTFAGGDAPIEQALDAGTVVPIESADQQIAGMTAPQLPLPRHVGGAAIILSGLQPPLSAEEIEQRVQRQRLAQGGGGGGVYSSLDVVTPQPSAKTKSSTAVILVSNPDFAYAAGEELKVQQWRDDLVAPVWRVTNEAIGKPAELQRVSNFDAQVAGETQRDALVALFLSIVVIMAYIWVRFGNLKYGTATVIALLHDTLLTLAAVGFAHYIAGTFIGNALLIEPFRVNLTLVAAVLTVMGYSMNDTVVVFDRIRENRGKFGHVSRQIINDSINQTLSRTLLTGGTTIVTIFVMYVAGGSGIHGFTFALLVGIVVGTYSSIAIAAPILLLGAGREEAAAGRERPVGQLQRAGA